MRRDDPPQPTLPLDFPDDVPVPYRLTARARRAVAPDDLPELHVVATGAPEPSDDLPTDLDDPHDTRRARARAMRRAGLPVRRIATMLEVDEVAVQAWIDDVGPAGRPRLQPVPDADEDADADERRARVEQFAQVRAAATAAVAPRLRSPDFVRGLALVTALLRVDMHAVTVRVDDLDVAARAVGWLVDEAGADRRTVRVVLRTGPGLPADLTAHRWSERLGLAPERISRARWRTAPTPEAIEARVRVADPDLAARIAGWRDLLLGLDDLDRSDLDVAF